MKILLTGTGFIGQNLLRALIKLPEQREIAYTTHRSRDYQDNFYHSSNLFGRVIHCDLTIEDDVKRMFDWFKPDLIYHLAGKATVKGDELEIMKVNVNSTHLLLKHCPQDCKFVLASSIIVHGDKIDRIGDSDEPVAPTSIYGVSKLCAEKLVQKFHMDGKVQGRILRLVANCGKGQSHGLVVDILNKLKSKSEFLELLGDEPGSCKPFVYVGDTVKALILTGLSEYLSIKGKLLVVNVGQEDEITVEQVAQTVMKTSGIVKPIKWLGAAANWKNDNPRISTFQDKLKYLGWKPRYNNSVAAIEAAVKEML